MTFADILAAHVRAHPSLQPQDALKLCYQAACGPEHLLDDLEAAWQRFDDEFTATPPRQGPLWEAVSDSYVRVDLGAWKAKGLPARELFGLFAASAGAPGGNSLPMEALLDTVSLQCAQGTTPFRLRQWEQYVTAWRSAGGGPVHHSEAYRAAKRPAYRLVRWDLLPLID